MWDVKIVIISQITNKKGKNCKWFPRKVFPWDVESWSRCAGASLAQRDFWSELIGRQTCRVLQGLWQLHWEMSSLLNHNPHCTVQVSDLISAYDFHHDVSIFHGRTEWVSVRMSIQISEVSHSRLSSTWSFHTNFCNILPFTAGNFAIVQHCQFQYE